MGRPVAHGRPADPRTMAERVAEAQRLCDPTQEAEILRRFGFAIPTDQALAMIGRCSPNGVIEIGAGTGYWASLLDGIGVDVVACDIAPPSRAENPWFGRSATWHPVEIGDERNVEAHTDRTLLLIWPTRDEVWPGDAVERYGDSGGRCVAYVGEPPGGRTGDDRLHALLGTLQHCWTCSLGLPDAPCICEVRQRWQQTGEVTLPAWQGNEESLRVFVPADDRASSPRRQTWRRAR